MNRNSVTRMAVAAVALGSILTLSNAAQAQSIIAPGTRPMWASLSFGPAIGIDKAATQFKLIEEFGYHFSGTNEGPALGASFSQSFASGYATIQLGPKFWWDIQPVSNIGFYVAPLAQLGYAVATAGGTPFGGGGAIHYFNMQFGAEAKLLLDNRWLVFFRPFTLDFMIGEQFSMRYDLMFGAGATF